MANVPGRANPSDSESEVWNAIAAFEKILEAIPDDRSSLETLFHAYEHIGDRARALDYLVRLVEVVTGEQDAETAAYIIEKLQEYGTSDGRIPGCLQSLRAVTSAVTTQPAPVEAAPMQDVPVKFRVADELSFAWRLFEAGEITQEEYAAVAHDLAELSVDGHLSTVSVLHVLEGRAFSGMERVMGFVSREAKTPIISLQSFDSHTGTAALLSREFMIRRGALVFDLLKEDALVAVMNPFDRTLRADIEKATGRACHYFMVLPRDFDAAVAAVPGG